MQIRIAGRLPYSPELGDRLIGLGSCGHSLPEVRCRVTKKCNSGNHMLYLRYAYAGAIRFRHHRVQWLRSYVDRGYACNQALRCCGLGI